jgi:putative ABC transport system ATP-binding protein
MLALDKLRKTFHEGNTDHVVLSDVSAKVNAGEIVALVGKSGSGKSTLLNLVSGIDLPTAGDIRIANVSIPALTEQQRTLFRRKNIGFIFQFFNLIPTLTVEENVLLPLELNRCLTPEKRHDADRLLDETGISAQRYSYPDTLSGGEQQRVAIIRALVHEPRLLLADEPTGNLDSETGRHVMDMLQRLVRRHGMTVLLVTHSDQVAAIADRVLLIGDGHVREQPAVK